MTSRKHEARMQQRKGAKASTISRQQLLTRPISEQVTAPLGAARRLLPPAWRRLALVGVKAVHSLIYVSVEFCVGYLIYAGLKGREERRTAIAAGVVAGESIIFLANQCRCPLTGLAKNLGAARGSVTDLYLPGFLASHLVLIHVPLLALVLCLHARNLLSLESRRRSGQKWGHRPCHHSHMRNWLKINSSLDKLKLSERRCGMKDVRIG